MYSNAMRWLTYCRGLVCYGLLSVCMCVCACIGEENQLSTIAMTFLLPFDMYTISHPFSMQLEISK